MHRIRNGKKVPLTEYEIAEFHERERIHNELIESRRRFVEKESYIPEDGRVIKAVLSQLLHWKKASELDFTEEMHEILGNVQHVLDEYDDIESENDIKAPICKTTQYGHMSTKIKNLEEVMTTVRKSANDAQASNEKIKEVVSEINSGLTAIKGFMMILPEIQQILVEMKGQLENNKIDVDDNK